MVDMTIRVAFLSLAAGVVLYGQPGASLTARQVIERIQAHVGVPWHSETVDTFKAGGPETRVTGIATTMMATYDVLVRSAAAGKNLIITHEPTFYTHLDKTDALEKNHDRCGRRKSDSSKSTTWWCGDSTIIGIRACRTEFCSGSFERWNGRNFKTHPTLACLSCRR